MEGKVPVVMERFTIERIVGDKEDSWRLSSYNVSYYDAT